MFVTQNIYSILYSHNNNITPLNSYRREQSRRILRYDRILWYGK